MAENSRNYALRFRESCCSSSRRDGNFKTKFCRMEKVSASSGVSLVGGAGASLWKVSAREGGGDTAPHTSSHIHPFPLEAASLARKIFGLNKICDLSAKSTDL